MLSSESLSFSGVPSSLNTNITSDLSTILLQYYTSPYLDLFINHTNTSFDIFRLQSIRDRSATLPSLLLSSVSL